MTSFFSGVTSFDDGVGLTPCGGGDVTSRSVGDVTLRVSGGVASCGGGVMPRSGGGMTSFGACDVVVTTLGSAPVVYDVL